MIFVESRRKSQKTLDKTYPMAEIIDLTSKGIEPFVRLSPFYPHGDIPVPFSNDTFSYSVEGIWQGLKVFNDSDIDASKFQIKDMKDIKRTVRKYGHPLGHRKGLNGELLDYITARKEIYIPTYYWVLENKASKVLDLLIMKAKSNDLVLLDYQTNGDIENTKKPISHAAIVKRFLEDKHPNLLKKRFTKPQTKERKTRKKNNKDKRNSTGQLSIGFK